jgi:hypothetical protein
MRGGDGSRVCDLAPSFCYGHARRLRRGGAGSHGRGKDNCTCGSGGGRAHARMHPPRSPCAFRHGRVARAARLPAPARAGNFVYSLAHVVLHHTIFLDFKFFYQFSRLNVAVQSTIFLETKQVLADQLRY